jgi:hypothetical protein
MRNGIPLYNVSKQRNLYTYKLIKIRKKERMLSHFLFLFYRNVCLGLSRTDNYTSYGQPFH